MRQFRPINSSTGGHRGWFPGYPSEMEHFSERRMAVAVQFNTDAGKAIKKGLRAYIGEVATIVLEGR